MTDLPDWIAVGRQVAVRDASHWNDRTTVHTVERLTATQIVLDNDARFRRDTLHAVGAGLGQLLPLNDPAVVRARVNNRLERLRRDLDQMLTANRSLANDPLGLMERVEHRVAETRASITALLDGAA